MTLIFNPSMYHMLISGEMSKGKVLAPIIAGLNGGWGRHSQKSSLMLLFLVAFWTQHSPLVSGL